MVMVMQMLGRREVLSRVYDPFVGMWRRHRNVVSWAPGNWAPLRKWRGGSGLDLFMGTVFNR